MRSSKNNKIIETIKHDDWSAETICYRIKSFNLNPEDPADRKALIEIVKIALDKDSWITCQYLKNFGFNPQNKAEHQELIKLAKMLAEKDPEAICHFIQNFGLDLQKQEDRREFIEVAKIVIDTDRWAFFRNIRTFINQNGQNDKQLSIEIAQMVAKKDPKLIYANIQNFGFDPKNQEDKQLLIELAQMTTDKDLAILCLSIKNFSFNPQNREDKQLLMEIAKMVANRDIAVICQYIKNFGLDPNNREDKQLLIELAQMAAERDLGSTCHYIQNFGLDPNNREDKQLLIAIAKMAIAQDKYQICFSIQHFGLNSHQESDQQLLVEIATMAAKQYPASFYTNIQRFGFDPTKPKDKQLLIKIAKMAISQEMYQICNSIQHFGFNSKNPEDRLLLIEIATMAAKQYPDSFYANIQHFGFDPQDREDRTLLIEITKISFKADLENAVGICQHIQKLILNPQNPEDRLLLSDTAKAAADLAADTLCKNIENFGFNPKNPKDKELLIEIAKIAAANNGAAIASSIQRFGLSLENSEDRFALIEILKIGVSQDLVGTFEHISRYPLDFNLEEEKALLDKIIDAVFVELKSREPSPELIETIEATPLNEYNKDLDDFLLAYANNDLSEMERLVNEALSKMENLQQLTIFKGLSERNKIHALALLRYALIKLNNVSDFESKNLINLLKEILSLQQPRLRYHLIDRLQEIVSDPSKYQTFLQVYEASKSTFKLPLLYSILLQMDREQIGVIETSLNNSRVKKDGGLKNLILDTLEQIFELKELNTEEKSWLICEAFKGSYNEIKETARLLNKSVAVFQGRGLTRTKLQGWKKIGLQEALKKQFSTEFKSLIPISSGNQNLYEKYEKMIGQFRDETALLKYMHSSIKRPGEDKKALEKIFAEFIDSLMNGSFQEWRYGTEFNPHLKEVFKDNLPLEEVWRRGSTKELGSDDGSSAAVPEFKELLQTSLSNNHLQKSQFPELVDYLNTGNESIKLECVRKLQEEKAQLSKKEINRLNFTVKAVDLTNKPDRSGKLTLLNNLLKLNLAEGDFKSDLEAWIEMLKQTQTPKAVKSLKVVEGDDPCDLLMCATEVLGSCQSIYGEYRFNKSLMGYIANGQNRLIAVKEREGKIVSRALIRLLIADGKPVLFLENLYPGNVKEDDEKAIYEMAIGKAKLMGLPLYKSGVPVNAKGDLQSLGGQAPYDYVDASNGLAKDSIFSIQAYAPVWEPAT